MRNERMHVPVLLSECINGLQICETAKVLVDCTFGAGGHSRAMLEASDSVRVVAIDRDESVAPIAMALSNEFGGRLNFVNGVFGKLDELVSGLGLGDVDGILYDLGFSSMQIDNAERGFSFQNDGWLSMQMGFNKISAHDVVNLYPEERLADILFYYGDERDARRIARSINRARLSAPIETTVQLGDIIASAVRGGYKKIHPATKSFQAIRIEVNDELNQIRSSLIKAFEMLKIGGRICVISFHSLEDRIVKDFVRLINNRSDEVTSRNDPRNWSFSHQSDPIRAKQVAKFVPTDEEARSNPRARSAKLRIIEKLF